VAMAKVPGLEAFGNEVVLPPVEAMRETDMAVVEL